MAFSLSSWFKGKSSDSDPDEAESAQTKTATPAPAAPPSVRTVKPNAAPHPAPASARPPQTTRQPISLPTAKPLVTAKMPGAPKVTVTAPPPRKVSFSGGAPSEAAKPIAAPAFTPTAPDVSVSLEVGDFIDRLPPSFVQTGTCNRHQVVVFPASELYSDLSKGRASVPASVIYQRCPEIFSRPVTQTEDVEVQLPLQKLVEQMGAALSTRPDQVGEENVGEIETPFLQVAMEDNARLPTAVGTAAGAIRPPSGLAAAEPFRPTGAPVEEIVGDNTPIPMPTQRRRTGQISTITPLKGPVEPPQGAVAPPTGAPAGPMIPGKRPPSTVRASVAGGKIRLSGPTAINRISPVPNGETPDAPPDASSSIRPPSQRIHLPVQPPMPTASPSHQVSKKTARIQIPPISLKTGGPNATPRQGSVPPPPSAPVPPPNIPPAAPSPGGEPTPAFRPTLGKEAPAITFRTSPPPPPSRPVPVASTPPRSPAFPPPAFPAVPRAVPTPTAAATAPTDDQKIELGLGVILRSLPSSVLAGEVSSVPDDVRISLPFSLIESQLSQGRVAVSREVFLQAMPEAHRGILAGEGELTEIPLPLQEVFQHLPANALSLRADQVTQETGAHYPTPFSQKAEEDAQRFNGSAAAGAGPVEATMPPTSETVPIELPTGSEDTADTVTDISLASLGITASPTDVKMPAEPVIEEPLRDIPLDPAGPTAPAKQPAMEETATDMPVEARGTAETAVTPSEEPPADRTSIVDVPAAEFPATPPETVSPEPMIAVKVEEPALPPVMEHPPETVAAAPAPPAQETIVKAPGLDQGLPPLPAEPATKKEPRTASVRPPPSEEGVLQALFMTEEEIDAKSIVKLVCQLPAVTGCSVMFEDGLRLAGNFPDGDTEGFSAMAPPIYKKTARFVSELELGNLRTFTLQTDQGLLSFLMHDTICLSIRHTGRGFMPGVLEKLEVVVRELAHMYTTAPRDN